MLEFTGERIVPGKMGGMGIVFAEHMERYASALEFCSQMDVLDAACGTGMGMSLISCVASSVTGTDISDKAVQFAKGLSYFCPAEFVTGDLKDLNFPDASFSVITSFETIEHLDDPGAFIDRCYWYLRPGGLVIASVPLVDYLTPYHKHMFTPESLVELFTSRGFVLSRFEKQREVFGIIHAVRGE